MDCKTSSNLMMQYMDQTIDNQKWADLQEHIHNCEYCREELNLLMKMQDLLADMEVLEPGNDFEEKVMQSIESGLYKEKNFISKEIKGVLISLGIYLVFLMGIHSMSNSPAQTAEDFSKVFYYLTSIGVIYEEIVVRLMVLAVYPNKLLSLVFYGLSQLSLTGIFAYGMCLVFFMVLLATVQTTLYKMLKDQ